MKRAFICVFGLIAALGAVLGLMAFNYVPKIAQNTAVGDVPVGALTKPEAEQKLRVWWDEKKRQPLSFQPKEGVRLPETTPEALGLICDFEASLLPIPLETFWESLKARLPGSKAPSRVLDPVFSLDPKAAEKLAKQVASAVGKPVPARALWKDGQVERRNETPVLELVSAELEAVCREAILSNQPIDLPLAVAKKRVPDEALAQIQDVVSEFTTRFPHNLNRNSNIRNASQRLNGIILMPGDTVSFNDTVGERTVREGFKVAGIYLNGRHDTGIGGGICQVSTTLYNAALLGGVSVVKRRNHSMPVPYVPVGRDAAVNYGVIDLELRNDGPEPIALSSTYENGRITFRILGKKDPSVTMEIVREGYSSWARGEKRVADSSLPPGTQKVIEKGSDGHAVTTYRVVYRDGVEIKREKLGVSRYTASPRIIAYGPAKTEKPQPIPASESRSEVIEVSDPIWPDP